MKQTNFFGNTGGLNTTDSPFFIKDNQAAGGWHFDYSKMGAIVKSRDRIKLNSVADTSLRTLGLGLYNSTSASKQVVRGADTKIQVVDVSTGATTNQTDDTVAAGTSFFSAGSTQQLSFANFNTPTASILWMAGGGAASILGFTGSKVTRNGSTAPTGSFTATNVGSATGGTWTVGTYFYSIALRKTSTQALSNAALDTSVVIATTSDTVLLTFPVGVDATLYDKWYVYRSAVGGVTSFTAGTLVAQVTVGTATYTDVGNVAVATSQVVPRAGNTTDNSTLAAATYKVVTTFKRRLVTASNSTFYLSDLDKPESWPTPNSFTIPTGGDITAIMAIGFNSPVSSAIDEYLVIFKETETWVFTGNSASDWVLKFVDNVGCAAQSLVVSANSYITWVDYRGIYMWDGTAKPVYVSRQIESLFYPDGDLDKTKLALGWGVYYRKQSQIIWCLSHRTKGENSFFLKLDLRLTSPAVSTGMDKPVATGIFTPAYTQTSTGLQDPFYAGLSYLPVNKDESFLMGNALGFIYRHLYGYTANGYGIDFQYKTRAMDMEAPSISKRFKKVVVWVEELAEGNLTLQYWVDYRVRSSEASQTNQPLAPTNAEASLWDLAVWDVSFWDDYQTKLKPITYNLSPVQNNAEGDSLTLNFVQSAANVPVVIHGFTVFWEDMGVRK